VAKSERLLWRYPSIFATKGDRLEVWENWFKKGVNLALPQGGVGENRTLGFYVEIFSSIFPKGIFGPRLL